jgi:GT2 family glycosyltransferase
MNAISHSLQSELLGCVERSQALKISVVIPHYNDLENLARCLDSVRRQNFPPSHFEIIVSDNNSNGGTTAVQRIAPDVTVITAAQQGAGPARNAGAAVARGTYLAFLDSDCVADENWLSEGLSAIGQYDYVGGRVITTVQDPTQLTVAEAFEAVFAFDFKKYIKKDRFSGTGNLFVPEHIFRKVGGFRSNVAEDIEWCHRANAMGFRLGYTEQAVVYHPARREWSALKKRWDRVTLEMALLSMERPRWRIRWAIYTAAVALSPLAHWLPVVRSQRLFGFFAKSRALFGLVRIRTYRSYRMLSVLVHPPRQDPSLCVRRQS